MKVIYEYDENKNNINIAKHAISFEDAHLVYENVNKITLEAGYEKEHRLNDIALVEVKGIILFLVYTLRQGKVRVISLRNASKKERLYYESQK
ncbi:MAG: hypothetical protein RLZZ210_782 [Pseudomonadota bacterium]|jgi:uncharacterized DUF497 family protein